MTSEMTLLRAFIEASGYEVERIFNYDEEGHKAYKNNSMRLIGTTCLGREDFTTSDYKVTKKELPSFQWLAPIQDFGKLTLDDPSEAAIASIRLGIL